MSWSFSRFGAVKACPASVVLPRRERPGERDAADQGTLIHLYVQHVRAMGRQPTLDLLRSRGASDDVLRRCEGIDTERLLELGEGLHQEVSYAIHAETLEAGVLGEGLDRAYPDLGPGWVCGTLDWAGVRGSVGIVRDLKTGRLDPGSPRNHAQLRLGAAAVAAAHGVSEVLVGIVRLDDAGNVRLEEEELDAMDLVDVRRELAATHRLVERARATLAAGGVPDVRPGPACTHCDAWVSCPAIAGVLRVAREDPGALEAVSELSPEEASSAYHVWRALANVTERIERSLRLYAAGQPIPAGNGKEWGPRARDEEELDPAVVAAVLEEVEAEDPDALVGAALRTETSRSRVEAALRGALPRGKGAAALREVLAEVRRRGGSRTRQVVRYEERRRDEEVVA